MALKADKKDISLHANFAQGVDSSLGRCTDRGSKLANLTDRAILSRGGGKFVASIAAFFLKYAQNLEQSEYYLVKSRFEVLHPMLLQVGNYTELDAEICA